MSRKGQSELKTVTRFYVRDDVLQKMSYILDMEEVQLFRGANRSDLLDRLLTWDRHLENYTYLLQGNHSAYKRMLNIWDKERFVITPTRGHNTRQAMDEFGDPKL